MTWTPPTPPSTAPVSEEVGVDAHNVDETTSSMSRPGSGNRPSSANGELAGRAMTIELPATVESRTIARTMVTCLAADAGLNVCEIDDVRLALDEMLSTLVDQTNGTIRMYLARLDNGLQAALSVVGGADIVIPKSAIMIMNALVDDVSFAGNYAIFTKRKQG